MPIRWAVLFARDKRTATAVSLFAAWLVGVPFAHAQTPACTPVMARVVSLQGSVELRSAGKAAWERVSRLDIPLCRGDLLRTGLNSRAALFIPSENLLRVDQNTTVSVHVEQDETVVEFFIDETARNNACGAGYAISRFPRKFRINTPFSYASVEGTEFMVALSCTQATVSVFEGKVSVEQRVEQALKVILGPGESASVGPNQPPVVQLLVKPADAVQWALFYPPLSDPQFGTDPLHAPCESISGAQRASCLLERAEALVRVGQVNEAQADIRDLLVLQPHNGDAYALRAVISVVRNERVEALRFAQEATRLTPDAYRPWLALSYAQQAGFKLEDALESARKAAALAPTTGLAQARVAELLLSLGRIREAEQAARQAIAADPRQSRGYVMLGFVQLADFETRAARETFRKAIELDSADPLPRLGLGLALIRDRKLEDGRIQIEIAVALDPTNSLLRSYLGKVYYQENTQQRNNLAASQFSLAEQLDPKDPTPWLYDAILKQTENRPVEALEELQRSIALNDNRAIYRSQLLLDSDRASRQTSLANIYNSLGLQLNATTEAAKSLDTDPANSSAHQFLSDVYAARFRHEVARTSELLQSQLYLPLAVAPVSPGAAFADLKIQDAPLLRTAYAEYPQLLQENGPRGSLSGLGGTQGAWGGELAAGWFGDRLAMSAGAQVSSWDGFRTNDDNRDEIYNVFGQWLMTPELSVQGEYRNRSSNFGDLQMRFDPTAFSTTNRFTIDQDIARVGLRYSPKPSFVVLGSYLYSDRKETQTIADPFPGPPAVHVATDADTKGQVGELQGVYTAPGYSLLLGGAWGQTEQTINDTFDWTPILGIPCLPPDFPCNDTFTDEPKFTSGYAYAYLRPAPSLQLTLGLSYDTYQTKTVSQDLWNPKLGIVWAADPSVTLRAAAFKNLKKPLIAQQTIEPTQIAGFNRLFDEANGMQSDNLAVGADLRLNSRLFLSLDAMSRELQFDTGLVGVIAAPIQNQREQLATGSVSWLVSRRLVLSAGVQYDYFDWDAPSVPTPDPIQLTTYAVPARITFYANSWLAAQLTATYIDQSVQRLPTSPWAAGDSQFTTVDFRLDFRLPRRVGLVSFAVRNLFDEQFRYQDNNFRTTETHQSTFIPERTAIVRVSLFF